MLSVRLFNPTQSEYEAVAAVHAALWPDEKQFPAQLWREEDEEWPPTALHQRFVLQYEGRIIGWGSCFEKYWQHQPGTVHIEFHVHPHFPGHDSRLYEAILDFLKQRGSRAQILATEAREDREERVRFLEQQGFEAVLRRPRSSLDVAQFDGRPFTGLFQKLEAQGIAIATLAEWQARHPDWKQRLFDLRWALVQGVPAVEVPTKPTMAQFEQMILQDPALNEDAWFIAADINLSGQPYVGMSNLWLNDAARVRLDTGLTGVLPDYRRRGIATALKLKTAQFAEKIGAQTIETDNEENNPVILINEGLGFRPKAAWVSYRKHF